MKYVLIISSSQAAAGALDAEQTALTASQAGHAIIAVRIVVVSVAISSLSVVIVGLTCSVWLIIPWLGIGIIEITIATVVLIKILYTYAPG